MFGSPIKSAIKKGDVDKLRALLHENPDLANKPISWGTGCNTDPLHYLSDGFFNNMWSHGLEGQLAHALLEAGASPEGSSEAGETPLHGAASLGCADVASALLEHDANIEAIASYPGIPDGTPLDFAIHFGMVDVIEVLVQNGARVLSPRMQAGVGDADAVKSWLLGEPRPDEAQVKDIFRCAAVCDRCEVIDVVLDSELIHIDEPVDIGTALHRAAWEAKPGMVVHLLANGADYSNKDPKYEMTAVEWAKHRQLEVGPKWGHEKVIQLLTEHQMNGTS